MLNRATAQSFLPATFQAGAFLAASRTRLQRRAAEPRLGAPLALSPLAHPGTPGQLTVRAFSTGAAARTREESWRRQPRSSAVFAPGVVVGSSLPVTRSPSTPSALSGPVSHPAPVRIAMPPWRFLVTDLDTAAITFLDRIALQRTVTFELDMPAQASGTVDGDNPEVYLDAGDGDPYLAEGSRLLYGFRREGGYSPDTGSYAPWRCRFAGLILQIEDQSQNDQPKSTYTAFDPWQYLMSRPVVNLDGTPPDRSGLSSTSPDFPSNRGSDIALELLRRTIQWHGGCYIDAGVAYGGTPYYGAGGGTLEATDPVNITFQQGASVGDAWKQLCDTGSMDIALVPIYDPRSRPGYTSELTIAQLLGGVGGVPAPKNDAIMAWDMPSRSLLNLDRLEDGTQRGNVGQLFTQGGIPVLPFSDAVSIAKFREWWIMQTTTGQSSIYGSAAYAYALELATVAIRKCRSTTIRIDPAAVRAPIPFIDYGLGDIVPIYASYRLRKPINGQGRVYKIPLVIDDNGVETVQEMDFSADSLEVGC